MAKKRKRRGQFCRCCERILPNERFSGAGHARHLCRQCSKLPKADLRYRQEVRNLLRLVTLEGIIGRKKRMAFAPYLEHSDARIRKLAEDLAAEDIEARRLQRWLSGADEDEGYGELQDQQGSEQEPLPARRGKASDAGLGGEMRTTSRFGGSGS